MTYSLQVLADNRDALLLAEVAAWLHMFGKFHEDFLNGEHELDSKIPDDVRNNYPLLTELLENSWSGNIWANLDVFVPEFQANGLSILSMIESHRNPQVSNGFLRLLADAHGRGSSVEKGVLVRFAPEQKNVYLSTSLGHEPGSKIDLAEIGSKRQKLYKFLEEHLDVLKAHGATLGLEEWFRFRQNFLLTIEQAFHTSVAETRLPLNDVTLYDQTFASVAFFKASLAQNLLQGWQEPNVVDIGKKYRWHILRVGLEGLKFWGDSVRIGDILARKASFLDALDRIKTLLEFTYPLGLEIYRDENGSAFIVPDVDKLLHCSNGTSTLEELIQNIAYESSSAEALLDLSLSERTRSTQSFGKMVTEPLPSPHPSANWIRNEWQGGEKTGDICPVCGLRPQGPRAKSRKVCDKCEKRRTGSSARWLQKMSTTIWIDEIANTDGRIALLVAKFGLDHWLSGSFHNTILSFDPSARNLLDPDRHLSYNFNFPELLQDCQRGLKYRGNPPSFSNTSLLGKLVLNDNRDRTSNTVQAFYNIRITDTNLEKAESLTEAERLALEMIRLSPSFSRIFRIWESTQIFWRQIEADLVGVIDKISARLKIITENQSVLVASRTYELKIGDVNLSIVCSKSDEYFTVDNLCRTAWLLSNEKYTDEGKAAEYIRTYLGNRAFDVEEPTGYGSSNKVIGRLHVTSVTLETTPYIPAITILAEPRTFMALVPADKALNVAGAIKEKYETEIGKVSNRLPLTMGIVFAGSRTPLPAILDAGRRMLKQHSHDECWKVQKIDPPHPGFSRTSWPDEITLTFAKVGQSLQEPLRIKVSTKMGDKTTPDVWYPYWCLEKQTDTPAKRDRLFKGINGKDWTHVCDLQVGDIVSYIPSYLDFEYLDTASRRFEISYDEEGKRRSLAHPARPYYLEQLDEFTRFWDTLSDKTTGLATSQIHNLVELIEAKRAEWHTDHDNPVFRELVREVILNAGWKKQPNKERVEHLLQAAISGQLADVAELYMSILDKGDNR
jgi:CRISPR-associated Csx11 family protein